MYYLTGLSLYSIQSKFFSYGSGLRCRSCRLLIRCRIVQPNLVILLFLLPYSCFLPLSLSYSRLAIPISLVALVLLSPTHLPPMLMLLFSCLSDLSFFISYPPLLILLRPYSCSSTPTLLLLSYSSLTPGFLLVLSCSYSSISFAVILILPTPSLLLLLD